MLHLIKTLIAITILVSCAVKKPAGQTQAEVLYKEAVELKSAKRFIMATEKLNLLKTRYPYSFYATSAELLLSDILFDQENYVDATASYLVFKDFHPKHQKIPYVIYKIAESYFKQIPRTFDRDLDSANEAIRYYKQVLANYPNSEYAKKAGEKIKKSKDMIMAKEQYIADFYYKTKVYEAAMWRYKYILSTIKEMKYVKHAMKRLVESSFYAKKYNECVHFASNFADLVLSKDKDRVLNMKSRCEKAKLKGDVNDERA